MKVSAQVKNTDTTHEVSVSTDSHRSTLHIEPKSAARGSSLNGGELLFLSLATCYCNDVFREAQTLGIAVNDLEVSVHGEFDGRGEAARNIRFDVRISADATAGQIKELLTVTDGVAEIQNTLRAGVPVKLGNIEIL